MATYKTGLETREKIYQAAQSLFYKNGYRKTTCQQIAEASGTNVGLIHYYFGGKGRLASALYSAYTQSLKKQVAAVFPTGENDDDLLTATALEIRVHTSIILKDPHMYRFYMDILEENLMYQEDTVNLKSFEALGKNIHPHYDSPHLKMSAYGHLGAQQGLMLAYHAGRLHCSYTAFADLSIELMLRIMAIDPQTIEKITLESRRLFNRLTIEVLENFDYHLKVKNK